METSDTSELEGLIESKNKTLIPFVMSYYPNESAFFDILCAVSDAGIRVLEIGVPFSDPVADGETIQIAGLEALKQGGSMSSTLKMIRRFRREKDNKIKIVLMGYLNPIIAYGYDNFLRDAQDCGINGLIIVDLSLEASGRFFYQCNEHNIHLIRLVGLNSEESRIRKIVAQSSGFIYCVSMFGATGSKDIQIETVKPMISRMRQYTDMPLAVGFGIRTPDDVKNLMQLDINAVVVGSELVRKISASDTQDISFNVKKYLLSLQSAIA